MAEGGRLATPTIIEKSPAWRRRDAKRAKRRQRRLDEKCKRLAGPVIVTMMERP